MKVRRIGMAMLVAVLATGCTKEETAAIPKAEVEMIRMKPVLNTLQPVSRSPFTGALGNGVSLKARVLATETLHNYTTLYANGTMTFSDESDPVVYDEGVKGERNFPEGAETPVYLRGFYPSEGWSVSDNLVSDNKATISLSGKEDVMMAAEVSTTKKKVRAKEFSTLAFEHQLTLLEIVLQTEGEKAQAKWKEVFSVEVTKPSGQQIETSLTANLADGTVAFGDLKPSLPTYALSLESGVTVYGDGVYAGTQLKAGETNKVAYALVPPVEATDTEKEYTFKVTTLKDGVKTDSYVDVNLNALDDGLFIGSTAGYSFVVTFYFLSGELSAVATVKAWEKGGSSVVPVE